MERWLWRDGCGEMAVANASNACPERRKGEKQSHGEPWPIITNDLSFSLCYQYITFQKGTLPQKETKNVTLVLKCTANYNSVLG